MLIPVNTKCNTCLSLLTQVKINPLNQDFKCNFSQKIKEISRKKEKNYAYIYIHTYVRIHPELTSLIYPQLCSSDRLHFALQSFSSLFILHGSLSESIRKNYPANFVPLYSFFLSLSSCIPYLFPPFCYSCIEILPIFVLENKYSSLIFCPR